MMRIQLNGAPFECPVSDFRSLGELIEFVKLNIDPESLLMGITIDGRDIEESEWNMPLASIQGRVLELQSGSPAEFLVPRLEVASLYVEKIRDEFTHARNSFRGGAESESHTQLAVAVQDLKAFIDWYENLLQMLPQERATEKGNYHEQVQRIADVCEQIHQQQTFRAWWALADTLERRLDPELERLQGCCVKVANA